ncbi:MAG: alanine--tRNA ligase-related protein, partial [Pseudomonadota bacterium]|nr:alanine--tRNA ligase-related protein [Pseudomonadota bacterium]
MTERVYEKDAYQQALDAVVVRAQEGAVVLDRTIFYARGGGQPGDSGVLNWDGGSAA